MLGQWVHEVEPNATVFRSASLWWVCHNADKLNTSLDIGKLIGIKMGIVACSISAQLQIDFKFTTHFRIAILLNYHYILT